MAETIDEARRNARDAFEPWVRERRSWLFLTGEEVIDPESREEYDELVALFEADLAAEPVTGSTFLIRGSE